MTVGSVDPPIEPTGWISSETAMAPASEYPPEFSSDRAKLYAQEELGMRSDFHEDKVEVSWVSSSSEEEEEDQRNAHITSMEFSRASSVFSTGNYSDPTFVMAESDVVSTPSVRFGFSTNDNAPTSTKENSYFFRPITPTSQASPSRTMQDPPPSESGETDITELVRVAALSQRLLGSVKSEEQEEEEEPGHIPLTTQRKSFPATNPRRRQRRTHNTTTHRQASIEAAATRRGGQERGLTWRMDPTMSLSDWTLEIFNRSSRTFDVYDVHRVILAAGPRACGFFQQAFSRPQGESPAKVTRLPFISQACTIFPDFLDFVYSDPSFEIQPQTAVGLAFLAHFLDQPELLQFAMEFVHQDLKRDNMHLYLNDAQYYDQLELVEWILQYGARELPNLKTSSPSTQAFLLNLSPDLFTQMMELVQDRSCEKISTLLVQYCMLHKHEVAPTLLEEWTSQLEVITSRAAMALLELDLLLRDGEEHTEMPIVQKRCLDALSKDWEYLCQMDKKAVEQLVDRVLATVTSSPEDVSARSHVIEWFSQTLHRANDELQGTQVELRESWEKVALQEDALSQALRELEESRAEARNLRKTLESTKTELREQLQGWIQKRANDLMEHKAAEQCWTHEREVWIQQQRQWLAERTALEAALVQARGGVDCNQKEACPQVETGSILSYISGNDIVEGSGSIHTENSFQRQSMQVQRY